MNADIRVTDDPAGAAAELLAETIAPVRAEPAPSRTAAGHVALTGGSTPRAAYERVAELRPDWYGVHVWFTDERCVEPGHEHSNFRMADESLLSKVRGAEVHRMRGELGPHDGAAAYERELDESGPERLDLILLGLGADAHICSLFPWDDALGERERRVAAVETPGMAPLVPRITLTFPIVNAARQIAFLVTGEDKAEAVARVFRGPPDPRAPGSLVDGNVVALLDQAAAGRL